MQLGYRPAHTQLGRRLRISEHDVPAVVHELTGVGVVHPVHLLDGERATGNRSSDRAGMGQRALRWQVRHPRRRLGRPIHHDQVEAVALTQLAVAPDVVGSHSPTCLRHVAQARHEHLGEADPVQQLERVRNAGERRRAGVPDQVPEAGVHHGQVGQYQTGTAQ